MFDDELLALATALAKVLKASNRTLTVAESCTGGLLAALVTEIAGSSEWFDCGIVSYSNQSKMHLLGVQAKTLEEFGAVSEQTAIEMTMGALKIAELERSSRKKTSGEMDSGSIAISITGIAGPGGGTAAKPVGTVCFAWGGTGLSMTSTTEHFTGDRTEVRLQAVATATRTLIKALT